MQVLVFLVQNDLQVILCDAIRVKQLDEVLIGESLEGATMVLTRSRRCQVNRLIAVPGLIVVALALLSV